MESGPAAIEWSGQIADIPQMPTSQHTIVNKQDVPIYISIEPWPECYELEPGDRLTLSYRLPQTGDALEIQFINERELVLWPTELDPRPVVLINDASAGGRAPAVRPLSLGAPLLPAFGSRYGCSRSPSGKGRRA